MSTVHAGTWVPSIKQSLLALTYPLLKLAPSRTQSDPCTALVSSFQFENTTVLNATRVAPGAEITVPGSCRSSAVNGNSSICRVELVTNTTNSSSVHMEAWLPDTWYGRFIGLGNGGLGGCIDYWSLPYTTSLNFATIGSDNGHDGENGTVFLNHPEVIIDFAYRSIHTEVLVGKALVQHYYGRTQDKSYYIGCSTGGRQGIKSAEMFPDDFDGIIAGAPAVDWNHLVDWTLFLGLYTGAPDKTSPKFIPSSLWSVIAREILNQCDALDGLEDGIISEPDACDFRPEALICSPSATNTTTCLTSDQVHALHQVYAPLFDDQEHLIFPRFDPGAEADDETMWAFSSKTFPLAPDWYKFVVYNDSNYDLSSFNLTDVKINDQLDAGSISTFSGDLRAFSEGGRKLLTYHGRQDGQIPSGNSKRLYNRISEVMGMPNLDSFYRLFLVPGLAHCDNGKGAFSFGQEDQYTALVNDTDHNILLALVDWVENGNAPKSIIGSNPNNVTDEREHCRYPQRTFWNGTTWICVV